MNSLLVRLRSPKAQLATLTLSHLIIDMYGGFLLPLIPVLKDRLGVGLATMTTLAGALGLVVNGIQPFIGWIMPRFRRPVFLLAAPVLAALMAVAPSMTTFWALAALAALAKVGIGAFHPNGLTIAHDICGRHEHVGVPIFLSGGYFGFSLGALISTQWVHHFGFDTFWWLAVPGVVLVALQWLTGLQHRLLDPPAPRSRGTGRAGGLNFWPLWSLGILLAIGVLLPYTYLNVHIEALYGEEMIRWGGYTLATIGLAGVGGSYLWGLLSARRSAFGLVVVGQLLCIPLYYLMIASGPGWAMVAWSVPTGLCMGGAFFPIIATAARRARQMSPAIRAGVMIGGSWGIASLLSGACGWLTDWGVSPRQILLGTEVSIFASAVLALWLYLAARKRPLASGAPAG